MRIATIILAAGSSSRLDGTPKQLLVSNGKTLICQIAQAALNLETGPVLVVLGANEEAIRGGLADLPVQIVVNAAWQEGIASSLKAGLNGLMPTAIDAFLVVLTDQPYVTTDLLRQLLNKRQQTGKGIVACRYGEAAHLGVPALFDIHYQTEFQALSGDMGARKLIQRHLSDCADVPFPLAAIDLDTWQDVERWRVASPNR
ncbi:nucleotidyltransferase family protein [Spirosoma koreense]